MNITSFKTTRFHLRLNVASFTYNKSTVVRLTNTYVNQRDLLTPFPREKRTIFIEIFEFDY